jgi:hypothetical protein
MSTWKFGDGTFSNEKNPTHYYSQEGNYDVCLEVRDPKFEDCNRSYCTKIYTSQSVENCFSDIPDNYTWKWVEETVTRRPGCCDKKWDNPCDLIYWDLFRGGNGHFPISSDRNYSLESQNARNPLMSRLMKIPRFRETFLLAIEDMIGVFHSQQVHFDLESKFELIKEAVDLDPHFIYPKELFYHQNLVDYPLKLFKKEMSKVPSLSKFLNSRTAELINEVKTYKVK